MLNYQPYEANLRQDTDESEAPECGICGQKIKTDLGNLGTTGKETVIRISQDLKDGLDKKLKSMKCPIPIHTTCRKKYTKPSIISAKKRERDESNTRQEAPGDEPVNRSQVKKYNPYTDCCLCNKVIPYFKNCSKETPENYDLKVPTGKREECAETKELASTIKKEADKRNDVWGHEVKYRLNPYSDLVALEAKLHAHCRVISFNNVESSFICHHCHSI